ncbi:MAG: hypothetical protein Q8R92_20740 [Deltaproteobacteria bacterium]|nr:hypothetical protein [Deltaproteobacteria bacterium]
MPVYPLVWTPLVKSGNYPHMAKLDAAIWERFLDKYADNYQEVAYDVALGGFLPDENQGDLPTRTGYQYSTALKVDAVLRREGEVWIVEVKPSASVSAIGGALCYHVMAEQDELSPFPLVPAVVTDRASPDIAYCAQALGVTLIEVGSP